MSFTSLTFLFCFLPIFVNFYSLIPTKLSNIILLFFSIIFYFGGEPAPVFLLTFALSIIANYLIVLFMEWSNGNIKKLFLVLGVLGNLTILFFFKYINFVIKIIENIIHTSFAVLHTSDNTLGLPLGISFITFRVISYIVDVYRGNTQAEKSILRLATYISMFPIITAGPIVRYESVINELKARTISKDDLIHGIKLFIIGLSFKAILANQFSIYADAVFSQKPAHLSIYLAWVGAISYTFQIYFDFAGYSIMAVALGRMIGLKFPDNFRLPYLSLSVTEFWRRWHMTLTSWLRDYLYIPLGGNRKGRLITYRNLFIVFLLCGIWHGANFTFIVWGIYHGLFLIIERALKESKIKISFPRFLNHVYLMLVVTIGWVLFRSEDLHYATDYIGLMFGLLKSDALYTNNALFSYTTSLTIIMLIGCICSIFNERNILSYERKTKSSLLTISHYIFYLIFFIISIMSLVLNTRNAFIYRQF